MTTFRRFVVLLALCLLAVLVPTAMYTQKAWDDASTAQLEDQGIAPSRALLQVIKVTQQHRGLSAVWLGGKPEAGQARQAKAGEVRAAIAQFAKALEAGGV